MERTPLNTDFRGESDTNTVVAVFYEDDRVSGALQSLARHGFSGGQIDVSSGPAMAAVSAPVAEGNVFLAGAETGLLTGGIVGGIFGLLMGVGTLTPFSLLVLRDISVGAILGVACGALLGGLLGCAAAWPCFKATPPPPAKTGVLVSVEAGPRDEEAKSALIEAGGDLNPTNAIEAMLL